MTKASMIRKVIQDKAFEVLLRDTDISIKIIYRGGLNGFVEKDCHIFSLPRNAPGILISTSGVFLYNFDCDPRGIDRWIDDYCPF